MNGEKTDKAEKFHLINDNTCVRLKLYGEDVRTMLKDNGWREAEMAAADYIFINTCAFLQKAENRAMAKIEGIVRNKKSHQQVAVFGCLPSINEARLRNIHRGRIFSGRNLDAIATAFGLKRRDAPISHQISRQGSLLTDFSKCLNRIFWQDAYFTYLYDKGRVFHLKISEGCLGRCSYCAERLARGSLTSRKIEDIVREFKRGLSLGYGIFSFNADDTGFFGLDNNENIVGLLREILAIRENFKLMITEFNPAALVSFSPDIIPLLSSPKIAFVTVPLQSGSRRILSLMNRDYEVDEAIAILKEIKGGNEKLKINTHIIVGFPGETEEDFRQTSRLLLDKFHFDKVKIFRYSERPNTAAAGLPDKISEETKKERRKSLNRRIILRAIRDLNLKEFLLNFHNLFWGV